MSNIPPLAFDKPFDNEDAQGYSLALFEGKGKILILGDGSGALTEMVSVMGMDPVGPDSETLDTIWVMSRGNEEFLQKLPGYMKKLEPGGKLILVGSNQFPFKEYISQFKIIQKKLLPEASLAAVVCTHNKQYQNSVEDFVHNHLVPEKLSGSIDYPLVSVLMPTYNRAGLLPLAVQSVLGQSFSNFEILLMDDGSSDGTAGVLKNLKDPRIKIFTQENSGKPIALNTLIAESRGKYLTILDDDDFFLPHHLQTLTDMLEQDSSLDYVWGDSLKFSEDEDFSCSYFSSPRYSGKYVFPLMLNRLCFYVGSFMITSDFQNKIGGYDPGMIRGQDLEMFRRMALLGKGKGVPIPLNAIRVHQGLRGSRDQAMQNADVYLGTVKYTSEKLFKFLKDTDVKKIAGVKCSSDSETRLLACLRAIVTLTIHNNPHGIRYYLERLQDLSPEQTIRGSLDNQVRKISMLMEQMVNGKLSADEFAAIRDPVQACLGQIKKIRSDQITEHGILILDDGGEEALEKTLMMVLDQAPISSAIHAYIYQGRKNDDYAALEFGVKFSKLGESLPDLISSLSSRLTGTLTIISSAYPWNWQAWPLSERITTALSRVGELPVEITVKAERLRNMKMPPLATPVLLKFIADALLTIKADLPVVLQSDFNYSVPHKKELQNIFIRSIDLLLKAK